MTVKEHYDNHLGHFYSWMVGDFEAAKNRFKNFCKDNDITSGPNATAIDLGAGNGIQSVALAELGFIVVAVDFNAQLLSELEAKGRNLAIETVNEDIRLVCNYFPQRPYLIVCCGDTLTHLESLDEIQKLITDCYAILNEDGKLVLSFRDYSTELEDTNRFINVKNDSDKILTCFLEYFPDQVRVTDLLYEQENGKWIKKVSSYFKTRITNNLAISYLLKAGFEILLNKNENQVITIIAKKRTI